MMVRGFPLPCVFTEALLSPWWFTGWRCCAAFELMLLDVSESGESCTVTQLMTFFLCLGMLAGACFCSSSSSVSLLMVITLMAGLGVSGMMMVCRWRSRVVLEAPSPQPQVTEVVQTGMVCGTAQRGGVFSFTRLDR